MPSPFEFGKQVGGDPMAAVNAKRVADMKAMASKVRGASGTPNPTGDGTHRWSGRVMPGGDVQGAQYTPPSTPLVKQPQQSAPLQKAPASQAVPARPVSRPAPRPAPMSMLSSTPMQPKVTTTPVDNAALRKQLQQAQQQSTSLTKQPPAPSPVPPPASAAGNPPAPAAPTFMDRARGAWNAFQNPAPPTPGAVSAPLSSVSTAFNNATGQQDPPHIITTDNGRKFNTQTKTFLDGRPGGFAQ